jgi:hypothetical protein
VRLDQSWDYWSISMPNLRKRKFKFQPYETLWIEVSCRGNPGWNPELQPNKMIKMVVSLIFIDTWWQPIDQIWFGKYVPYWKEMFATEMAPRSLTLSVNWMVCSKTLFEKYGPLKKGWFTMVYHNYPHNSYFGGTRHFQTHPNNFWVVIPSLNPNKSLSMV